LIRRSTIDAMEERPRELNTICEEVEWDSRARESDETYLFVQTVQEFWRVECSDSSQYLIPRWESDAAIVVRRIGPHKNVGADVGCEDDDAVLEVDTTPLRVCEGALIQYLEEDVGDVSVSLLEFVEENDL
jgi:hypothetical protein